MPWAGTSSSASWRQPPRRRQPARLHPPGVYGPLGGTASAAKMLKLTQEQVQMALGIAASRTGGLFANNGTMVKSTHPGNAARHVDRGALLARRGFRSHDAIFEAPRGYVAVLFDDRFDWDGFLADAGTVFHLVDPGFHIKRYPAQIGMQPVINVMSDLRDTYHLTQEEVATIEIELSRALDTSRGPSPRAAWTASSALSTAPSSRWSPTRSVSTRSATPPGSPPPWTRR